jgi:hypothetical protein
MTVFPRTSVANALATSRASVVALNSGWVVDAMFDTIKYDEVWLSAGFASVDVRLEVRIAYEDISAFLICVKYSTYLYCFQRLK